MSRTPEAVTFARRAVYLQEPDVLVLADVHLGRDRASDVQLPLGERADVIERLQRLLDQFAPAEVVVAGDLLHSFSHLPDGVGEAVEAYAAAVEAAGASLVVTPGNHDAMLAAAIDGPTPATYRPSDDVVVCHGHERPDDDAGLYVVGHDHPSVTVEGRRHPCALYGESAFRGGDVLVLPAFSRLARGVDVGGQPDLQSPLVTGGAGRFRPIVYDDDAGEALAFPPLAALREHL